MKNIFIKIQKVLSDSVNSEKERSRVQFLFVFIIFAVVSFVMTVLNYFTGWKELMWCTFVFSIANVVNALLAKKPSNLEVFSHVLFGIEIILLTTFFIILGEPEGFSAIWSALLPVGGLLLYRKKYGTILSAIQFVIIIFLFWTPFGRSVLPSVYTTSFMMRFPLLYFAFYCIGFFFEFIRDYTQKELALAKEKFEKLSYTDLLTGLENESSYIKTINDIETGSDKSMRKFGVLFMDLNCVKDTNDKYGHRYGCHLITETGRILPTIFNYSKIFHIGGDEFVVIVRGKDYRNIDKLLQKFDEELECKKIEFEGVELILSVARGYAVRGAGEKYVSVVQRADEAMYQNKRYVKDKYNIEER